MRVKTARRFSEKRKAVAVFFVLILMGLSLFYRHSKSRPIGDKIFVLDSVLQWHIDSLKARENPRVIYPFNPNFISDQRGYFLGLSPKEIDRLQAYRAKGKWLSSIQDFQRITQVDSQWLEKYSPFFVFPKPKERTLSNQTKTTYPPMDLNRVTAEDLQQINGIGNVLSKRILNYRKRLGGFADKTQLEEVYGLSPEVVNRLKSRCSLISPPFYEKISLQEASLDALSQLPYLSYQEARSILLLRTEMGSVTLPNLHSIKGFDSLKIKRLALYLF